MCFSLVVTLLAHVALTGVWAEQQTGTWYGVISQQQNEKQSEGDSHSARSQMSSDRARISRAVPGRGLTIKTLPDNMTRIVEDSGKYYTWRSFGPEDPRAKELWVDMTDLRRAHVRVHGILSNSYKQAVSVPLSFDFPFYGHYLRQVTIATGGFIFTGDITHHMLTTTQYIAPLMANFDPGYSKDSTVQYLDDGEVFVVQWEQVRLSGKESEGAFTFQAALYKTGTITFGYREMPLSLDVISSAEHSVKVGLSDAFVLMTSEIPETQQMTIYEYHRVELDTTKITSYSAVEFRTLPACLQHHSCDRCLSSNQTSGCSWCHVLQRCSDGMDRHRQEWLDFDCSDQSQNETCEDYVDISSTVTQGMESTTPLLNEVMTDSSSEGDRFGGTGVIAGVAAASVLLLALVLVALYLNHHSTSASPFYLIQRRKNHWPSWRFQKQQPGYSEVEEGHQKDSIVETGTR
ncbi:plexin domain-containing protein 1-like [Takifugu rubripes]|uniref:Plexin domain containing 1 n=1 Tax=Takifugu rubripes TaxID=31033 RepID=H2UZ75_TAKRU|nr:plexin domain-containing protein 1-like [Takifugu rubripes]|eukprot:XP_011602492.1 PREDICTED: plexin domain-containing protein 1-like isoform X1 [Takifugu rubripes]